MLTKKTYENSRKRYQEDIRQRKGSRRNLTLSLVVLLIGFGSFLGYYLYASEDFLIKNRTIEGLEQTTEAEVDAKLKEVMGKNIFFADMTSLAEDISALPWVQSVELKRLYPDSLSLIINERVPALWLQRGDERWLLDEQGVAVYKGENSLFQLPVLTYSDDVSGFPSVIVGEKVNLPSLHYAMESLSLFQKEASRIGFSVSGITSSDGKTFRLTAKREEHQGKNGKNVMEFMLISTVPFVKGEYLQKMISDYQKRKGKVPRFIDFRFNSMVIMRG